MSFVLSPSNLHGFLKSSWKGAVILWLEGIGKREAGYIASCFPNLTTCVSYLLTETMRNFGKKNYFYATCRYNTVKNWTIWANAKPVKTLGEQLWLGLPPRKSCGHLGVWHWKTVSSTVWNVEFHLDITYCRINNMKNLFSKLLPI